MQRRLPWQPGAHFLSHSARNKLSLRPVGTRTREGVTPPYSVQICFVLKTAPRWRHEAPAAREPPPQETKHYAGHMSGLALMIGRTGRKWISPAEPDGPEQILMSPIKCCHLVDTLPNYTGVFL